MKRMQTNSHFAAVRRGFSLIELLIVLAILVLLASLVAPRLLGSREQANIDAAKTQIKMLQGPLEMYSLAMGGYPTTEQGLKALIEAPSADSAVGGEDEFGDGEDLADLGADEEGDGLDEEGGGSNSNWKGPYIKAEKVPVDPWGSKYRYEFPGQNNTLGEPDIWSIGPDRKDNTEDDITSWSGERKDGEGGADDGFDDGGDSEEVDLGDE